MSLIWTRGVKLLLVAAITTGMSAGCGSAQAVTGPDGGERISIVDFAQRKLAFGQLPERIVALGSGEVDIIYALGGTVVGRPSVDEATLIEQARDVPTVGSVHTVDLERLAALKPDVVLGNYPINVNDVAPLRSIGTEVVLTSANSIDDIRRQIRLFGEMLDRKAKAEELVAKLDEEIGGPAAEGGKAGSQSAKRVLIVYGAPGTYMAALPQSLAGDLLRTAGGNNVAADFPRLQSFPQYAQLNTERVVEANPDVILIMTHGDVAEVQKGFVREMEGNQAWSSIAAVRDKHIHVLPAGLFGTNPGTRAAEAVRWLKELLAT